MKDIEVRIGALGIHRLKKGVYLYVGSARGPGGLASRVGRHLRKVKNVRWHIDYLTTHPDVEPLAVIYAVTDRDLEEDIAFRLSAIPILAIAIERFGCSDRRSPTHLFRCLDRVEKCIDVCRHVFEQLGLDPVVVYV